VKSEVFEVSIANKNFAIRSNWNPGELIFKGTVNAHPVILQVERFGLFYQLCHSGMQFNAMVMSKSAANLQKLMPFKAPPDLSKFLLSPMPGLLVNIAVKKGQKVQAGERLASIEAMKMENVLFASQDAEVLDILANQVESLAVDQHIIQFN
jgi:propionyl-CoA carboxylase alpha chain